MKSLQFIKVLLIEDNPSDALLLQTALEEDQLSKFSLTHVERLSDGLKQLDGDSFDIILADLGLPDSSGLETYKRLHKHAPAVPVIVFSGNEDEEQAIQAMRDGAQDYLVKGPNGFDMAARSIRYAIERNKLQSTLRESEQRFSILFHSNPVPVGITRQTDYRIVDVNDAWSSLTGYSREEAIGHTSTELGLVKPEILQQIRTILKDQGELSQFEVPLHTRSGQELHVLVSSEPIQLGNETYVLNNLLDITDRKLAEEALKESEARFSTAFFTNPMSQSILSMETGKVIEVNDACCRLYGFSREELIGSDPGKLKVHLWANPAEELAALDELQKTGHVLPKEVTIQVKSGEKRTILFTVEPIPWEGAPCLMTSSVDITDRKQAEEKLRESEVQLRQVLNSTQDAIFALNREYRLLINNEAHQQVLVATGGHRFKPGEMVLSEDYPPEMLEFWRKSYDRALQGEVFSIELSWADIEGRRHVYENNLSPLHNASGTIIGVLAVAHEITERKLAEEKLRESEARLKNMIDLAMDAIVTADKDQNIVLFNGAAERMFGATTKEALGQPISRFIPDRFHEYHKNQMMSLSPEVVQKIPANKVFSITGLRANGEEFPVESTISYLESNGEKLFTAILRDVTERKTAEIALRESEDRLRKTIETTSDGFWIVNSEGRFVDVNEAYCTMSGYAREELLLMSIANVEVFKSKQDTDDHIKYVLNTGRDNFETLHRRKDGSVFDVDISVNVLSQESGLMVYFCRDITQRKQAQREVAHRQELLEKVIQLGKNIATLTDLEHCLHEIYNSTRFGLGYDRVGLFLYDETLRHALGMYGTSRTGEVEEPGFFDGPIEQFDSWEKALQNPKGISWVEDYQKQFAPPEGHAMYGVGQHVTVAAWSGKKPVALITIDNLLTGREIKPTEIEALLLFAGYVGLAIENATLHTELELKVQERTAEVKDLYDNAPAGYHSLDSNGRYIQVNQTELKWLGRTYEEVMGHHISEFLTEQSQLIFQETFPRIKKDGFVNGVEIEMIRKDGSIFPTLVNATAVMDGRGNFLMSRTTIYDHTERKQVEEALRENQANLQYFFDTASDLIQSMDENGNYLYVNAAWSQTLGYTSEEAKELSMLQVIVPAYHEHCRAMLNSLVIDQHPQQLEVAFLTKQGHEVIVEGSVSSRKESHGHIVTNGIFRNITERKRAEASMQRANIELERALRMKDEFLASMSHELRTPLNGILGMSETLQEKTYGELNARQLKAVGTIAESGQHLLALINDILDLSKIESGMLELSIESESVADICQASLHMIKGMAQKKQLRVSFAMTPPSIKVYGDGRRIKQMLVNLLSNAIKFTPEGRSIGLDVKASETEQEVYLTVWDNGIGIAEENIQRLFQPFVQLESNLSRQYEGTGLGLSIVQRIAKLHNGHISVKSSLGQGSQFTIILPWSPNESRTDGRDDVTNGSIETITNIKDNMEDLSAIYPLVLIVDDNEIAIETLSDYLSVKNFRVMSAQSGMELLKVVTDIRPDIILMDIQMPGMDGFEAIRRIRSFPEDTISKTPIIAVTALAMSEDRDRCLEAGANEYMSKPVKLKDITEIINALLKNSKQTPQADL